MARIFTIYFEYKGAAYNAMVSVRPTPFFTEYTLNHFDDNLMRMLPGNKIIATPSGQFSFQNTPSIEGSQLMNEILKAVASHLHGTEV